MAKSKRSDRRIKLPLTSIVGLGFGAFVALAIGLVLSLSVSANFSNTFSLLNDKTILSTEALETQLRTHFNSVENAVVGLKPYFDEGTIGFEDPERTLEDLSIALKSNSDITTLAITATDGRRLGIYRAPSGKLWRIETDVPPPGMGMDKLPAVSKDSPPTWGALVEHEVGLFANVSVPLVRNDELIGMLTAASSMKDLSHIISSQDEGFSNTVFIMAGDGRVIMRRGQHRRGKRRLQFAPVGEQPYFCGLCCQVCAAVIRDQEQRQLLPPGRPARGHDAMVRRAEHQSPVEPQADIGIVTAE